MVLGVSGGPDSICMLSLFLEIKEEWHLTLVPVHLNHMIRGPAADEDALYVSEFCKTKGLECMVFKRDIAALAENQNMSLEEAGRKMRRDLLRGVALQMGADRIALGQNRNDQAETLLMRIMRGTGLQGLTGIGHMRENLFIRPLLIFDRSEIERYCTEQGLAPRIDRTNLLSIYTRNKIRLELLPLMQTGFNEKVVDALFRMGEILRTDSDYIEKEARDAFDEIAVKRETGEVCFAREAFCGKHEALQARILRYALESVKGDMTNISQERVSAAVEIIKKARGRRRLEFPGNLEVSISGDSVHVGYAHVKEKGPSFEYALIPGGFCHIEETGDLIETEIMDFDGSLLGQSDKQTVFVDFDKLNHEALSVRNRRNGDAFTPIGMKGSKKVKDFLIDEKIEWSFRDRIPLICDGSRIIWVAGHRLSDVCKTDKGTKTALKITIRQGCYEK